MKKLQRASRRLRVLTESKLDFRDARAFFRYANARIGSKASVSTLKGGVDVYSTPEERANHLAIHFESVFVSSTASHTPLPTVRVPYPDTELDVSERATCSVLLSLKASTNRTPENIPQLFYKKFSYFLAEPLSMIFSKSYRLGSVPDLIRCTTVTPIFKKGAKCLAANYRPVAQGCVAAKILEKLIANHLQAYLSRNSLLDPAQHGFVPRKSTATQLLPMVQDWSMFINSRRSFHCVYIDQKAAFDRIPQARLLRKLSSIGIHHDTVAWIGSFLANRTCRVTVDSVMSSPRPATSPGELCLTDSVCNLRAGHWRVSSFRDQLPVACRRFEDTLTHRHRSRLVNPPKSDRLLHVVVRGQ